MTTIENTSTAQISAIVKAQRAFFASHKTLSMEYRMEMLRRLRKAITDNEEALTEALRTDLNKRRHISRR